MSSFTRWLSRLAPLSVAGVAAVALTAVPAAPIASAGAAPGSSTSLTWPLGPQNPFIGSSGSAAPHNQSQGTDATPQPGPGAGPLSATLVPGEPCQNMMVDSRGYPIALCLDKVIPEPGGTYAYQDSFRLLDPSTLGVLASLQLPPTGPVDTYPYLDQSGRIVYADGAGHIIRVAYGQGPDGQWQIKVVTDWNISSQVTSHCGGTPLCDYLVSVIPDWSGRLWFGTFGGVIGTLDPATGAVHTIMLPQGEIVQKDLSSAPDGVAVDSSQALYMLSAGPGGAPQIVWREPYDAGTGITPGQNFPGNGTSGSFFGPGDEYVSIIDNASPQVHLLVFQVGGPSAGRLLCSVPLWKPGASGTNDTSMAAGNSVIAYSTYGYNYYNFTPVPLPGGITRVDVSPGGSGCQVMWTNPTAAITMSKLSASTGDIYTFTRTVKGSTPTYSFVVIDARTGRTLATLALGSSTAYEGWEQNGAIGPDGSFYQGDVGGIVRVSP
jgi:hypothetical protein